MRLIDADKLKEKIRNNVYLLSDVINSRDYGMFWVGIEQAIDETPTVDVERHGHWEYNPKDAFEVMYELPKCSVCGHESSDALNYCSNCGALMDEVEEDEYDEKNESKRLYIL